jgi:hypothetical protein
VDKKQAPACRAMTQGYPGAPGAITLCSVNEREPRPSIWPTRSPLSRGSFSRILAIRHRAALS